MLKDSLPDVRPITLFAFIAKENETSIVVLDYTDDPAESLRVAQRRAAKEASPRDDALVLFARYCNEQKLTPEFHKLATFSGDNPHYEKRSFYGAALRAGLYPKFYYKEDIARELIEKVRAGRLAMQFPKWPEDLYPTKPFINPFYEHYTLNGGVVTPPPITTEIINSKLAHYLSYLLDQPIPYTHLTNRDTQDRPLFKSHIHLGTAVAAMERRGIVTRIGDDWIESDVDNRRMAYLLLACKLPDLSSEGVPDDSLPPYAHAGIALKLYENRQRPLKIDEWRAALREVASKIVNSPAIGEGPDTPEEWVVNPRY